MADIISGNSRFGGNKNGNTQKKVVVIPSSNNDQDDLNERIRKHRRRVIVIIICGLIILLVAILIGRKILLNRTYSSYSVVDSVSRDDSQTAKYMAYNGGYIRVSNDGIGYFLRKGTPVWNQSFSMQNPQIKVNGDNIAVGDINGSTIYTFNKAGMVGKVDTSMSIAQVEVAQGGIVAAVLEDESSNYINLYNKDGKKIYTVKTTLAGDGYPLDISISKDATKLMASFLYVSGETTKTNVVFYNFSEVGQNETERIVGGFNNFDTTIVADVQFLTDTVAVAIGEDIISIYSISEYPKLEKEISINERIDRVLLSEKYIGVVLKNTNNGDNYRLNVYNTNAKMLCNYTFSTEYDNIQFVDDKVLMNNSTQITLINFNGKVITDQKFDIPIENIEASGKNNSYMLINSRFIQFINLK